DRLVRSVCYFANKVGEVAGSALEAWNGDRLQHVATGMIERSCVDRLNARDLEGAVPAEVTGYVRRERGVEGEAVALETSGSHVDQEGRLVADPEAHGLLSRAETSTGRIERQLSQVFEVHDEIGERADRG